MATTRTLTDGARRLIPAPRNGSPPSEDSLLSGQVLDGRYEVGRRLGVGGMSEVYQARQLPMGRTCAIKVLLASRRTDPEALARFDREAALASRISHPNLCHIYDAGRTTEGLPYLAMEWLDGVPLAEALHDGPLPPPRVADIARGCAAGLAAAHAAGVVHRDLKPGNVMLVQRDGREVPVVMDFGIAADQGGTGLTRDGMMVGTPEVMSPEQIAGDPVDERNDQYQLALLACRMLTGQLPFPAESSQSSMVRRLTDAPTPLTRLSPDLRVGPGVQLVLDRALSRRPADRFPDIRAFAEALDGAIAAGPEAATELLSRAGATGSEAATPVATLPWRAWAGAGVLIAAVAAAYLAGLPDPAGIASDSLPPLPPVAAAPAPTPPPPAPAPTGPAPLIPSLPPDSLIFSDDPAARQAARSQAERVYRSAAAPRSDRARAAYIVADILLREGLPAAARRWLEDCLALEERVMCRQLLNSLP